MRHALILLFACIANPLSAVVVAGPSDGDANWWREGTTAPWSFGVLDENNDGKVSQGELANARQQFAIALKDTKASLMAAVDLDQSGKLSRYEAAESSKRITSLRERAVELARAGADRNHDGTITEAERGDLDRRLGQVFLHYDVALVDANHDKNFSRTEVQAAAKAIKEGKGALFRYCDVTNDGQLSVSEVAMAFDLMAAAAGL
ncbi:MAG TPA: hypothetical protein VHX44_15780 [Planctomycetota bacterium]|nr:hypothetical protein [Planctomycetota bacterium]